MRIRYNVTGTARKALVTAIGELLQIKPIYKGIPTYAYEIGEYIVDKDGALTGEDSPDLVADLRGLHSFVPLGEEYDDLRPEAEPVPEGVSIPYEAEHGGKVSPYCDFEEPPAYGCVEHENSTDGNLGGSNSLIIEIPRPDFTDAAIENLKRLAESKATLIKKSLGVETLDIIITEDTIRFPWFSTDGDANTINAYTHFVSALCEIAKNQKRVSAVEKPCENEKYAFRCFLLRLGFIGPEYNGMRKILLSRLTGSAAFRIPTAGGGEDE